MDNLVENKFDGQKIENYDMYLEGMKKSIRDKLFFEGLVSNVDTFVDFGCADGEMLRYINKDFPEWKLFGIDMDEKMLESASLNCDKAEYVCSKNIPYLPINVNKSIINLSSVIHEIYAYSSKQDIKIFWEELFQHEFEYISIRDLMISSSAYRKSDINDMLLVSSKADKKQLSDFTSIYGDLGKQNNLLHFLMKYRYLENWDREVEENYFPITVEEMLSFVPTDKYRIVYFNHYILPFNRDKIMEDYNFEIKDNTHVKILLQKKRSDR